MSLCGKLWNGYQKNEESDCCFVIEDDGDAEILFGETVSAHTDKSSFQLTYPMGKGALRIVESDSDCLREGNCFNDVIIDFYLDYIIQSMTHVSDRDRTHVFSSFFFPKLLGSEGLRRCTGVEMHTRVAKWTKGVNIFTKQYIIIPISLRKHWFVVVVCYPSFVGVVQAATEFIGKAKMRRPAILLFDSINKEDEEDVADAIRDYLSCEFKVKFAKEKQFTRANYESCTRTSPSRATTLTGAYICWNSSSDFSW
ncbi:hypothetical protein QAD02_000705 [Eretmocerus hayati]|uniref:Uncharacterized protein n=1 Tax=Eretmocerus hayati TaxID=131215 RepID=A0ACC2NFK4_9HYME|nr:hypothetical protein QAD02_000705 [Eretmocerus hayati]